MPKISIIIPTFNRPTLLQRAIASCIEQRFQDIEIIVVNDAGTDVADVAQAATYLSLPHNRGLAGARNAGLSVARGEYVTFLDDDDLLLPNHLESLLRAVTPTTIAYSDYWRVAEGLRVEERTPEFDYDRILTENFIPVNCFLAPRQLIEAAGRFDEWLTALEDWDLWLRLSRGYRFHHVSGATCEVRIGAPGESITTSHPFGFSWASLNILYKNIGLLSEDASYGARCRENALAALRHLTALVVRQLETGAHDHRAIFGRHDLATAAERLAQLRELYDCHRSTFFEVEGYVELLRGQLPLATSCFERALAADPSNQGAAALLQLLTASR